MKVYTIRDNKKYATDSDQLKKLIIEHVKDNFVNPAIKAGLIEVDITEESALIFLGKREFVNGQWSRPHFVWPIITLEPF